MNILVHLGKKLPEYLKYCIQQYYKFNEEKLVLLTDSDENIENVDKININEYHSDKIEIFKKLYNYGPNNFWTVAALRLFYIENFMKKNNIKNVFHFENDVLIYFNINNFKNKFIELYENISITTGGPDKSMTGFMYIKNYISIEKMTNFFIDILSKYGINGTQKKYGMDMVHEMSLMKIYGIEKGLNYIDNLPILPFGDFSKHYTEFNSIFDPATWGQFVGGTRVNGPGTKPLDHYIGQLLIKNPKYNVIWKKDNNDRKIPYFKYDNNEVKINNLHIHSKNLKKYIS
jgi:hypothetical protein